MLWTPFRLVNSCRHFEGSHSSGSSFGTKKMFPYRSSARNRGIHKQKFGYKAKISKHCSKCRWNFCLAIFNTRIIFARCKQPLCFIFVFIRRDSSWRKNYFRLSLIEKRKENTFLRKVIQNDLTQTFPVLRVIPYISPASIVAELRSGLWYLHLQSKAILEK